MSYDDPKNWCYTSPETRGMHLVVSPENSALQVTSVYRLNLAHGARHSLGDATQELNAAVIDGKVSVSGDAGSGELSRLDSLYLPAGAEATLQAERDAVLFVGAAPYEGVGEPFLRIYEPDMPLGEIHQIHGEPPYEREVFMVLNQETPASRMINGFTWGAPGMWTSWPPHQHSSHLEEVYCYFDIPAPQFALHISSRKPGEVEAVHPVRTGNFVVIPEGYHPTVGTPGVRSSYFWVMGAHSPESRRYDLAQADFGV
jgi:5-deoxy-glucuronate isomerase